MNWFAVSFLALGGLICLLNFYLVFLRYPFYRLAGGSKNTYHFRSGIPLLGSLLVAASLIVFWHNPWLVGAAIFLMLIDIDGFHWYAVMYFYFEVLRKKRPHHLKNDGIPRKA